MSPSTLSTLSRVFFALTVIASGMAGLQILMAGVSDGWPEVAARSAFALALIVVPYCLSKLCYMQVNITYLESIARTSNFTANNSFHLCKMQENSESPDTPE